HTEGAGDGLNDLEMIEWVGHAIVMGQAKDELKALATVVTGRIEDDGLATALVDRFDLDRALLGAVGTTDTRPGAAVPGTASSTAAAGAAPEQRLPSQRRASRTASRERATPSSSTSSVTAAAVALTEPRAVPLATPCPARDTSSMSFGLAPHANTID